MSNHKMINAPKGTHDILPSESFLWQHIENVMKETCLHFGYKQIRFPVFEHTELFNRGVGDTTDVVQKEMYTFTDKGGRSITLRPEGTASTVRSYLEHSLYALPAPVKLYYLITCYRYERPQAGRFREFNQFGIENFGSSMPGTDAEVISLAMSVLTKLGVKGLTLYINSIGCPECRKKYNQVLHDYLSIHKDNLCDLCLNRLDRNPLRILDCKNDQCKDIIKNAPSVDEVLCDECKEHFDGLKNKLDEININYQVDTSLVRGLDYYTRTVFEIKSGDLGAQSTVCGGGRYDGLVEELGGKSTPGIGFSLGIERLVSILEKQCITFEDTTCPDLFIAHTGSQGESFAFKAVNKLRENGITAEFEQTGRSVKAQMKYADKIKAKYCCVVGDDEIKANVVNIKNMATGDINAVNMKDLLGGKFDV